jgi:hypothetical protein
MQLIQISFPNGLLLEQQGWKLISSNNKWLENADWTRFVSNRPLCNGSNQFQFQKKKKLPKKKNCRKKKFFNFFVPTEIGWAFNPG